jgi:hypothetical protein
MTMIGISTNLFHPKFHIKNPAPPDYEPLSISRYVKHRRERKRSSETTEKLAKTEGEQIPTVSTSNSKDHCSTENIRSIELGAKNKLLGTVQNDKNLIVRSMDRLNFLKVTNLEKALSLQSLEDFADVPVERHRSEELTFTGSRGNVAQNNCAGLTKSMESVSKVDEEPTFKEILFSPIYMLDLFWVSALRLRSWFFMGTFNPLIAYMAKGDDAIGKSPGMINEYLTGNSFACTSISRHIS